MEYRLRRHDGEYRWLFDVGVPRFNGDGSFAGYVGCCLDISDLKEARATVIEFSGRLLRAGEMERARIARELHDDINQRLALLANGLQEIAQATPADADRSRKQELQELWELTNEIATDIQHMSHQLHPSKLHYLGLASTVRDLCREVSQQHKIEIECVVSGLPEDLDENVSLNLFRTVQESLRGSLTNCRRWRGIRSRKRTRRSRAWTGQHARAPAVCRRRVFYLVETISGYAGSRKCSGHHQGSNVSIDSRRAHDGHLEFSANVFLWAWRR
jgi:hypothetical protein